MSPENVTLLFGLPYIMLDCVTSWVIIVFVDYEQIYILCYISNLSILWNLNLVAQINNYGNRNKFLPLT